MQRVVSCVLLLLVLFAAGTAAGEDDAKARKKRIEDAKKAQAEADKKFAESVNAAIDRGEKWLASQQSQDGSLGSFEPGGREKYDLGLQALSLLTLVKCGMGEKDAVMQKGMARLRYLFDAPGGWKLKDGDGLMTYTVSSMVMFYEALYDPPPPAKTGERYAAPKKKACKFPKEVEEIVRFLVSWLVEKQAELVWRYPGGHEGPQDLSNTQYALLALQAASRCGIEAPANVYKRVLMYLFEHQEKKGPEVTRWIPNPAYEPGGDDNYGPFTAQSKDQARGWGYLPGPVVGPTGSMTTAGIAGLSICRDRLRALDALDKETDKRIERSLLDGLAWLGKEFRVDTNPGAPGWHYYYLYGLERAGAMTGLTHFAKHDWYREGADFLLKAQMKDGGWPEATNDKNARFQTRLTQTCFALLFLRRATVPPALPVGPVVTGD